MARKIRITLEKRAGGLSHGYRITQLQNAIVVNTLNKEYIVGSWIEPEEAQELVSLGDYEVIVKISKL